MTVNVLYAIRSPDNIPDVCHELASAIVQNLANKIQAGLFVYGHNNAFEYVHEIQKVTVRSVAQLRIGAYEFYQSHEKRDCPSGDLPKYVESDMRSMEGRVNSVVCFNLSEVSMVQCLNSFDPDELNGDHFSLGMGRKGAIGPRFVKRVKTFDGNFTVGDPDQPLLSIPISLYPVTRRSKPLDTAKYVDNRRVVQSSTLKSESGADVDPRTLEKAYVYLNELVTADKGIQGLMNGEYNGAEKWGKAFELLATVPRVPPWIPLERTDVVVGGNDTASEFLQAFGHALNEKKMHAIVRMCHDPRKGEDGQLKLKGKLELVVLQPGPHGQLLCSPLPFRDDYKYYYRFYELPTQPEDGEEDIDENMDKLVDAMTTKELPSPGPNALNNRIAKFVRDKIALGKADVPPVPETRKVALSVPEKSLKEMSSSLMSDFGIHERNTAAQLATKGGESHPEDLDWDFEFV